MARRAGLAVVTAAALALAAWFGLRSPVVVENEVPRPVGQVVVKVRDRAGRPVPGAKLRVGLAGGRRIVLDVPADGNCVVPLGPDEVALFRAAATGDLVSRVETCAGAGTDALLLEVAPGVRVSGVVVDSGTGAPVAGAIVRSSRVDRPEQSPDDEIVTRADGTFGPAVLDIGEVWAFRVTADSYFEFYGSGDRGRDAGLRIALVPHGSVTGTVRTPDGAPVADAEVVALGISDFEAEAEAEVEWMPSARAPGVRTDAAGRFRITALRPGNTYAIAAYGAGWAPSVSIAPQTLTTASPRGEADVVLRPGANIDIRVLDPKGGRVTGALVTRLPLTWRAPYSSYVVPEDSVSGRFALRDLSPGSVLVVVDASGFVTAEHEFVAAAGGPREAVVRLVSLEPVRGRVVDDRGVPVAGAAVTADPLDEADGLSFESATVHSRDDGTFDVLAAPCRVRLRAHAAAYRAPPSLESVIVPGRRGLGTEAAEIRLVRLSAARVRLVPPAGHAPPADVILATHEGTRSLVWTSGRYAFADVSATDCRVFPRGFVPIDVGSRVRPGESVDLGDVTLDPGVTLRGRVVDDTGAPVAGALVWVVQHDSAMDPRARTAADGAFAVPHAAPGENDVRVVVADATRWTGTLRGDAKAEIRVPPAPR